MKSSHTHFEKVYPTLYPIPDPDTKASLHGKRVPLGDRGTLPSRVEDTVVVPAKFEHGRSTLPSRDKR